MDVKRPQRGLRLPGRPDFDIPVPGTSREDVLVHEVPGDAEDLAPVLFPLLDRVVIEGCVEEFYGAVARCDRELVGVVFREGDVEEGVLCVVPAGTSVAAV